MAQITFVDKPSATPIGQPSPQSDARARAIATLTGNIPQGSQGINQNSISVEETGALKQSTAPVEQPDTTEATPPTTKEEPLSTQHAILARKEKALRAKVIAQEQSLKAREAALAAREAEINAKANQDLSNYIPKDKLKQNAYSVLSELGVSPDTYAQQALMAQSPESQYIQQMRTELEAELQKVREEQANTRKAYEEQQAQSYQQALNQIRTEARQLVNSDPSYETIKATGTVNDVVDLIERTFKKNGNLLTVEQAAQAVEDHLIEEAIKMTRIKKIQDRLKPTTPVAAQQPAKAQTPQPQASNQMKTLTNAVGSTRPLTAKERALLAFRGELNK